MMPLGVEFCKALKAGGLGRTVIEIGAKPAAGQEEIANLRPIFEADRYVGVDMEAGLGVDIVSDGEMVYRLFERDEFELGISLDTLEHCWRPIHVVYALAKVALHVAIRAPFAAPIHNHPEDFWRFTPACFGKILKPQRPHGFIAVDPPVVNCRGEWPHGVYGFATHDSALRTAVIQALPQAITVTGYW